MSHQAFQGHQQVVENANPTLELRLLTREDGECFCRLFSDVFGQEISSREWIWKYFENPDALQGPYAAVADRYGVLLGCYSLLPRKFYRGTQVLSSVMVADNAIQPAQRNFSMQRRLKNLAVQHASRDAQFGFGFPNDRAMQLGIKRLNYRAVNPLLAYRKKLSRWTSLRHPWRNHVFRNERRMETSAVTFCDREFDEFFHHVCEDLRPATLIGRRDARWLNWRFLAHPQKKYQLFAARCAGVLCGYVVTARYRDYLEIVDCFHDGQRATVSSLLSVAEDNAQHQATHGVQIRFMNDPLLFRELRRRGFRNETTMNLSVAAEMFSLPESFATTLKQQWLLTLADSDVV